MKISQKIMRIDRSLDRLGHFLNRGALVLCVALAAADLIVVILEVITRTAGATLIWTEELSRWLLVWMTFIGASVVLREKGHIRVEFFISICPKQFGKVINLIGQFGILLFLCFFIILSWWVAVDALGMKGDIILLPMFYPKLALVLGGGLMLIHQLHAIVLAFRSDEGASQNN